MGRPRGVGNRLVWEPSEVLTTLAGSITKGEMVRAFRTLPAERMFDVLLRLEAASGSGPVDHRVDGGDRGR